jgi:hypothetical protein
MKPRKATVLSALVLLLAGCDGGPAGNPLVPCLHPLFTQADLDFDPALVGVWAEKEGEVTFTFQKSDGMAYQLTITEDEASAQFQAHLVRLGGFWFLDLYPDAPEADEFSKLHLLRAHSIARVWLVGDRLRLGFLDSKWLREKIEEKSVQMDHQKLEGAIVLTAATDDLQGLVFRYANDENAFPKPMELERKWDREEPGE